MVNIGDEGVNGAITATGALLEMGTGAGTVLSSSSNKSKRVIESL